MNSLYRQIISILNLYSLKLFTKSADLLNITCNRDWLLVAARILGFDFSDICLQATLTSQISQVADFCNIDGSSLMLEYFPPSWDYFPRWMFGIFTDEIPSWRDDDCLLLLYIASNLHTSDPDLLKRVACILGIVDVGRYLRVTQELDIPFKTLLVSTIHQNEDSIAFYNKYKRLLTKSARGFGLTPTDAAALIDQLLYRFLSTSGTGKISDGSVPSLKDLDHEGTVRRLKRQLIRFTRAIRRKRMAIIHAIIRARLTVRSPTLKNKHIAYRARSSISCCRKIHQSQALTNRTTTREEHSLLAIVMLPRYSTCAQFLLATDDVVALTRRSGT
jgi:hypothetical protein